MIAHVARLLCACSLCVSIVGDTRENMIAHDARLLCARSLCVSMLVASLIMTSSIPLSVLAIPTRRTDSRVPLREYLLCVSVCRDNAVMCDCPLFTAMQVGGSTSPVSHPCAPF